MEPSSSSIYSKFQGPYLYDLIHGKFYPLQDGFVIGRSAGNLQFAHDGKMSRQHCRILVRGGRAAEGFIEDLNTSNGTTVGGERIAPGAPAPIPDGALIEAGEQIFCYLRTQEIPNLEVDAGAVERAGPEGVFQPGPKAKAGRTPAESENDGAGGERSRQTATETQRISRAPRVRTLPLHRITFKRTLPAEAGTIQVANISSAGIAFLKSSALAWPPRGSVIQGTLAVQGQRDLPIQAKIARITPLLVGCSFEGTAAEIAAFVETYFRVELEALKIRDVSGELPAQLDGSTARRFVSENSCELYYAQSDSKLTSWYVTVFGNRIESDPAGKLKYVQDQVAKAQAKPGSSPLPPEVPLNAIRFVENVEALDEEVRSAITYVLSRIRAAT